MRMIASAGRDPAVCLPHPGPVILAVIPRGGRWSQPHFTKEQTQAPRGVESRDSEPSRLALPPAPCLWSPFLWRFAGKRGTSPSVFDVPRLRPSSQKGGHRQPCLRAGLRLEPEETQALCCPLLPIPRTALDARPAGAGIQSCEGRRDSWVGAIPAFPRAGPESTSWPCHFLAKGCEASCFPFLCLGLLISGMGVITRSMVESIAWLTPPHARSSA